MPADAFLRRLDSLRDGMPLMLQAADLFVQKKEVEGLDRSGEGIYQGGRRRTGTEGLATGTTRRGIEWQSHDRASRRDQRRFTRRPERLSHRITR
jgi:hypothetical protein